MEIPESEAEARAHIAQIRKNKRLDRPDSNTSDLENALIILSEQLYQESTHFLLELIQNADDNTYAASEPTLNITFSDRIIRIDCNEVGFSKANTEAICKIGRSTKRNSTKGRGILERRGLDSNQSSKSPMSYGLALVAILSSSTSTQAWIDGPEAPNFLRQLRQLNITVLDKNGRGWSSKLGRRDMLSTENNGSTISLHHNSDSMSYKIIRHAVSGLPIEPKRLCCSESEILLAFPLNEFNEPLISSQKVYAFLPIRDYGFKFLVQADFLLIASREDIDSSSDWNQFLLEKLPEAFRHAVHEFNTGELRYSWMRYLPSRASLSDFFQRLESNIIQSLASEPILESLDGKLNAPSKLRLVPANLSDDYGLPLVQSRATKLKYISPKYSVEKSSSELLRLGVMPLTPEQFIVDLKLFIVDSPREFHEMPKSWHSCLCNALFRLIHDRPRLKSEVSMLEIVPLKDGRWRSTSRETMCFLDSATTTSIPKGISIVEIDPHASSDHARRSLFILLGAMAVSDDMVCKTIISTHSSPSFRPHLLSRQELISHVTFLYHADWKNFNNNHIWLSTECGTNKRSCEVYVDSEQQYSATMMFQGNRGEVSFLHDDYFKNIFTVDETFRAWLVDSLHLAEFPRIVPHRAPKITLSDDFQLLLQMTDYLDVLLLLRDHWEHYSKWIIRDDDRPKEAAKMRLREKIAGILVKLRGGGTARLKETVLPLSGMMTEDMTHLSFIDIPDPENEKWKFLSHFHVVVNPGTGPFIQRLRLLKKTSATLAQTSILYS